MSHILHLDASAGAERSISRTLSYEFLTAWKDTHSGNTVTYDSSGYRGLVKDRKMLVLTAQSGSYRPGTPTEAYNFHEPYLRTIFGLIGITDIYLCRWAGNG